MDLSMNGTKLLKVDASLKTLLDSIFTHPSDAFGFFLIENAVNSGSGIFAMVCLFFLLKTFVSL